MREQKPAVDLVEAIRILAGDLTLYGLEAERNRVCNELVRCVVTGEADAQKTDTEGPLRREVLGKLKQAVRFCRLAIAIHLRYGSEAVICASSTT